jgi:hypothetical protein
MLCACNFGYTASKDNHICICLSPAGVGHKLQAGAAGVTNSLQAGAAGVTSKLSGMGWGAKQAGKAKVEPEATSSVKEAEMTAASPGVTTRRRMAAAPASD